MYHTAAKVAGLEVKEFTKAQAEVVECLTQGWMYEQTVIKLVGMIRSAWYVSRGGMEVVTAAD